MNVFMDGRLAAGSDADRVRVIGIGVLALFVGGPLVQVVDLAWMAWMLWRIRKTP